MMFHWGTYDQDMNYDPLTFLMEGGMTADTPDWRVELTPLNDAGFKQASITVFSANFLTFTNLKADY